MLASDDPAQLTPDERFDEVAKILARGLLRLKRRCLSQPDFSSRNLSESGPKGLEVPGDTRLSGHTG